MVYHTIVLKTVSGHQVRHRAPQTLGAVLEHAVQQLQFARASVKIRVHDHITKLSELIHTHGERADVETVLRLLAPKDTQTSTAPLSSAPNTKSHQGVSPTLVPSELTIMVFGAPLKYQRNSDRAGGCSHPTAPIRSSEKGIIKLPDMLANAVEHRHNYDPSAPPVEIEGPIPFPLCTDGLDELLRLFIEETTTGSGARIPSVFPMMTYYTPAMQFIIQYVRRDLTRLEEVLRQIARCNEELYACLATHPRLFLRLLNDSGPTMMESQRYALLLFARQVAQGTMELVPGRQEYLIEFGTPGEQSYMSNVQIDFTVNLPEEEEEQQPWDEDGDNPYGFGRTFITMPQNEDEVVQMLAGILDQSGEDSRTNSPRSDTASQDGSHSSDSSEQGSSAHTPSIPAGRCTPCSQEGEDLHATPPQILFSSLSRVEIAAAPPSPDEMPYLDVRASISYVMALIESNPLFWISDERRPQPEEEPGPGKGRPNSPSIRQIRHDAMTIINAHHRIQEVSVQLIEELEKSLMLSECETSLEWFLRMAEAYFCDVEEFYVAISKKFFQNVPKTHPLRASLHSTFDSVWRDHVDCYAFMAAASRLLVVDAAKHVRAASTSGRLRSPGQQEHRTPSAVFPLDDTTDSAEQRLESGGKSRRFGAIRQLSADHSPLTDPAVRWRSAHGIRTLMENLMSVAQRQRTTILLYTSHRYGRVQKPIPPPVVKRRGSDAVSSSSSSSDNEAAAKEPEDTESVEEVLEECEPEDGGVRCTAYVIRGDTSTIELRQLPPSPLLRGSKHDSTLATFLRLSLNSEGVDGVSSALHDTWKTLMRQHYDVLVPPVEDLLPPSSEDPNTYFYVVDARLAPSYLQPSASELAVLEVAATAFPPSRFFPALCDAEGRLVLERWSVCMADQLWNIVLADEAPVLLQPPTAERRPSGPSKASSLLLTSTDQSPHWLQSELQLRLVFHQQNVRSPHHAGTPQHMVIVHEEAQRHAPSPSTGNATSFQPYSRRSPPLLLGDLHVVDQFLQPSTSASALRQYLATHNVNLMEDAEGYGCDDVMTRSSVVDMALCRRALEFLSFSQSYHTFHATLMHNAPFTYPLPSMTEASALNGRETFFGAFYHYLVEHPDHSLAAAVRAVALERVRRHAAPWQAIEGSLLDFGGPLAALPLLRRDTLSVAAEALKQRSEAQFVDDNGVDDVFELLIGHLLEKQPVGEMDVLDELIAYLDENKEAAQQVVEARRNRRASGSSPKMRLHAVDPEKKVERKAVRKVNPFPAAPNKAHSRPASPDNKRG